MSIGRIPVTKQQGLKRQYDYLLNPNFVISRKMGVKKFFMLNKTWV